MDTFICNWIPCTDGNPEVFKQLVSEIIKISGVSHSYSGLFIISIKIGRDVLNYEKETANNRKRNI